MPFTPIHLGPGLALKAIGGRHFSFMVFGGAQVLMDIEPLIGILRGWPVLHGRTHSLLGALSIGLLAGAIGRPISAVCLRWLRVPHAPFTWRAAFAGGLLGTYSHVLLDAIMHYDMQPAWPLSQRTGWRRARSMRCARSAGDWPPWGGRGRRGRRSAGRSRRPPRDSAGRDR